MSESIIMRLIMWIIILILANAVYSLWKKESKFLFIVRTLLFVLGALLTWFI